MSRDCYVAGPVPQLGGLVAVKLQRNDMTAGCSNEQEWKQLLLGKVGVTFMPKPFLFCNLEVGGFPHNVLVVEGTPSTVDREFAEAGNYSVEKFGYFVQLVMEMVSMMVTLHLQHYSIVDAHSGNIGVRMRLKNYLQSVERRAIFLPPRSSPSGQDVVEQIIRVVHVDPERNEPSKATRSNINKYLSICVEDWIFQIVELSKCDPTWKRAGVALDAKLSGW